ncbi:MAG: hypothetical protein KDD45_00290, partial [Bdellovibrionales bacterium]|nr:hypothetical protein [Bdellovibrionales bacterium]
MKNLKRIFIYFSLLSLFFISKGFCADRSIFVQAKIERSLSQILQPNDYLVIVNKLDDINYYDSRKGTITGTLKPLPGLNLDVDERGQVVSQNQQATDYRGPLFISVIFDKHVNQETQKTIIKNLPEISGGLLDDDELKTAVATLRQETISNQSPSVSINNQLPENKSYWIDSVKLIATLSMLAGILLFFISRLSLNKKENNPGVMPFNENKKSDDKLVDQFKWPDFTELSPSLVSLFIIKQIKEKNNQIVLNLFSLTDASFQRKVMMSLPAWVSTSIQKLVFDNENSFNSDNPEKININIANKIYLELTILEHSFKTESDYEKAFLLWFPPEMLRFVPKFQQKDLSIVSKTTLWYFRQDLGGFIRTDTSPEESLLKEPQPSAIHNCYVELKNWTSTSYVFESEKGLNIVNVWSQIINSLHEFGPIDFQVEQAKLKLTENQYKELENLIVRTLTPLLWSETKRKSWLRNIEPDDFYWWRSLLKEPLDWNLKSYVRTLRYGMF